MKQEQKVRMTLQIHNSKEVESVVVDFYPGTTVEELILFLKEEEYLPLNICDWKCYCQQLNRYYHHKELIDISLSNQTIIIFDNDTQKELIKQNSLMLNEQFNTIKEISWICEIHPNDPIIFICLDKHSCQRKMCQNCILDQNHIESKHNFLPINHFFSVINTKAKQFLNQRTNIEIIDKYLDDIERDVHDLIQNYKIEIQKAKKLIYDSFVVATDVIDFTESQNICDSSPLKEIVHIYKSNEIYKQEVFNGINLKAIQDNIQRFNLYFAKFKQEVENLKFIVLAEHEYQDLKNSTQTQSIYEEKSTATQQDQFCVLKLLQSNGQFLVSLQGLKIEIKNNFSLQGIYKLNWSPNLTLRDIDTYVKNKLITNENYSEIMSLIECAQQKENLVYYSALLNEEIEDQDKKLYHIVRNDLIKVTVKTQLSNFSRIASKLIPLKLQIVDGEQIKLMSIKFDQQYTIQDIKEFALQQCETYKNQSSVDLDSIAHNQILEDQSSLTLQQLQITANSLIEIHINEGSIKQFETQESITQLNNYQQSPTVQLKLSILYEEFKRSLSIRFQINDNLDNLVGAIQEYLHLSADTFIDIFIDDKPFNSQVQRKMTLRQLNLQDNQIIQGKIRYVGD